MTGQRDVRRRGKALPGQRPVERLQALYDRLPAIACQGLCWHECSFVPASGLEQQRVIDRTGHRLDVIHEDGPCRFLTADRKCGIYNLRPAICRLYGLVPDMQCPHGCEPERWMTAKEGAEWLDEVTRLSVECGFGDVNFEDAAPYLKKAGFQPILISKPGEPNRLVFIRMREPDL